MRAVDLEIFLGVRFALSPSEANLNTAVYAKLETEGLIEAKDRANE